MIEHARSPQSNPVSLVSDGFRRQQAEAAREKLIDVYQQWSRLMFLHYSCGSFDRGEDPPAINYLYARDSLGRCYSFCSQSLGEIAALQAFRKFCDDHPQALWVVWNMRNDLFGFPALQARQRYLELPELTLPDEVYDLSHAF